MGKGVLAVYLMKLLSVVPFEAEKEMEQEDEEKDKWKKNYQEQQEGQMKEQKNKEEDQEQVLHGCPSGEVWARGEQEEDQEEQEHEVLRVLLVVNQPGCVSREDEFQPIPEMRKKW